MAIKTSIDFILAEKEDEDFIKELENSADNLVDKIETIYQLKIFLKRLTKLILRRLK